MQPSLPRPRAVAPWVVVVFAAFAAPGTAGALAGQEAPEPRVVALGGSVTETVFALGAQGLLVGVDQSSVFPAAAGALPDVGYFRTLGAEGVLSLRPDVVLALEGSGPPAVLEQLRAAGVEVVSVPADEHPRAAIDKVRLVAAALGRVAEGEELEARIAADLERLATEGTASGEGPRALFVWGRGGNTLQVSGRGTAADAMLRLVGAVNAVDGFDGYKPLTPEAVVAARPDVLVVDAELLERLGGVEALAQDPALGSTPAVRNGRVVPVEILGFIGFGPRTAETALRLRSALHDPRPTP